MVRRLCGTVGTGQGLIGANRSGLLVRRVVRFAVLQFVATVFPVRVSHGITRSLNSWSCVRCWCLRAYWLPTQGGRCALPDCCECNQAVRARWRVVVQWFARSELPRE